MRLDLAQYRELAAFSQFGSDLDQATQNTLERGARMMEILKQDQYAPLPVEEQVAVLYFATHGFAKGFEVSEISKIGYKLLDYLREKKSADFKKNQEGTRTD